MLPWEPLRQSRESLATLKQQASSWSEENKGRDSGSQDNGQQEEEEMDAEVDEVEAEPNSDSEIGIHEEDNSTQNLRSMRMTT